jgi:hypothetical protein
MLIEIGHRMFNTDHIGKIEIYDDGSIIVLMNPHEATEKMLKIEAKMFLDALRTHCDVKKLGI